MTTPTTTPVTTPTTSAKPIDGGFPEFAEFINDPEIQLLSKTSEELDQLAKEFLKIIPKRSEEDIKKDPSLVFELLKIRILQKNDEKATITVGYLLDRGIDLKKLVAEMDAKIKRMDDALDLSKVKPGSVAAYKKMTTIYINYGELRGRIKNKIEDISSLRGNPITFF